MKRGLLALIFSALLVSCPTLRSPDSRRLLRQAENGTWVLYEFEDLNWDANVEICASGDPERKIKVYYYVSEEYSRVISYFNNGKLPKFAGYTSHFKKDDEIKRAELFVMDKAEQEYTNSLFSQAESIR